MQVSLLLEKFKDALDKRDTFSASVLLTRIREMGFDVFGLCDGKWHTVCKCKNGAKAEEKK